MGTIRMEFMKVRIEDLTGRMFINKGYVDAYYVHILFASDVRVLRKDLTFTYTSGYNKKEHKHLWDAPGWYQTCEEAQEMIQKIRNQGFALVEI
jgi:hypothetical protein